MNTGNMNTTNTVEQFRAQAKANFDEIITNGIQFFSSGRVRIGGGNDDGVNALQINGNTKVSGLAGTNDRIVVADSTGLLKVLATNTYTPSLSFALGQSGNFTQVSKASYIVIGNIVKVIFEISASEIPSAGSYLNISLPIPRKTFGMLSGYFSVFNGINFSATADFLALSSYGSDYLNAWFIKSKNNGTGALNTIDISEISSGLLLSGTIEYEI